MNMLNRSFSSILSLCLCISLLSSRQALAFMTSPNGNALLKRSSPMIHAPSHPALTLPSDASTSITGTVSTFNSRTSATTTSAIQLKGTISDFVTFLQDIPEGTDLTLGAFMVFCGVTPYFLGLFFPEFFNESMFMKVYGENDKAGRYAENAWKKMYATQGLVLTSLLFWAALDESKTTVDALRLSYVSWALFYLAATVKLAVENRDGIVEFNRIPSQIWHLVMAGGLMLDLLIQPTSVEALSKLV